MDNATSVRKQFQRKLPLHSTRSMVTRIETTRFPLIKSITIDHDVDRCKKVRMVRVWFYLMGREIVDTLFSGSILVASGFFVLFCDDTVVLSLFWHQGDAAQTFVTER